MMKDLIIVLLIGIVVGAIIASKNTPYRRYNKRNNYTRPYNQNYRSNYPSSNAPISIPGNSPAPAAPVKEEPPENDMRWKDIKVVKRKYAFDSKLEQDTYNFLRSEFRAAFRIDFHVHLNEIFRVDEKESYFNKLWVCHVDFLIRNRKNPSIIYFAIELDKHDAHKNDENVKINDEFKSRVFRENNIPLLRLGGENNPDFIPFKPETYPAELVALLSSTKEIVIGNLSKDALDTPETEGSLEEPTDMEE